jgi:hypothetical protein
MYFNDEIENSKTLDEFVMEWRRTMNDYPVAKSVPRIENKNWKKIKNWLKPIF